MRIKSADSHRSPDDIQCSIDIGVRVELLVDSMGDAQLLQNSNLGCQHIGKALLKHHKRSPGQRMCRSGCPLGGHLREICASPNFSVVHPVKDVKLYSELVMAFP